jgi:hypothetical protein
LICSTIGIYTTTLGMLLGSVISQSVPNAAPSSTGRWFRSVCRWRGIGVESCGLTSVTKSAGFTYEFLFLFILDDLLIRCNESKKLYSAQFLRFKSYGDISSLETLDFLQCIYFLDNRVSAPEAFFQRSRMVLQRWKKPAVLSATAA